MTYEEQAEETAEVALRLTSIAHKTDAISFDQRKGYHAACLALLPKIREAYEALGRVSDFAAKQTDYESAMIREVHSALSSIKEVLDPDN